MNRSWLWILLETVEAVQRDWSPGKAGTWRDLCQEIQWSSKKGHYGGTNTRLTAPVPLLNSPTHIAWCEHCSLSPSETESVNHSVVADSLWPPWAVACQAPLSMVFSRQEYWSGLPCPSPGDLPNPGIKPLSPTLQVDSLPSKPPGKPLSPSYRATPALRDTLAK